MLHSGTDRNEWHHQRQRSTLRPFMNKITSVSWKRTRHLQGDRRDNLQKLSLGYYITSCFLQSRQQEQLTIGDIRKRASEQRKPST